MKQGISFRNFVKLLGVALAVFLVSWAIWMFGDRRTEVPYGRRVDDRRVTSDVSTELIATTPDAVRMDNAGGAQDDNGSVLRLRVIDDTTRSTIEGASVFWARSTADGRKASWQRSDSWIDYEDSSGQIASLVCFDRQPFRGSGEFASKLGVTDGNGVWSGRVPVDGPFKVLIRVGGYADYVRQVDLERLEEEVEVRMNFGTVIRGRVSVQGQLHDDVSSIDIDFVSLRGDDGGSIRLASQRD
jgi:hypothetical protein